MKVTGSRENGRCDRCLPVKVKDSIQMLKPTGQFSIFCEAAGLVAGQARSPPEYASNAPRTRWRAGLPRDEASHFTKDFQAGGRLEHQKTGCLFLTASH
ncbi:hypothetical protein G7009_15700 [Pseudomonas capeferrum]|uniref:hypothetical protein n=1 Tax=Pseudomonas capeferrum TaxID=1495066 RepID=UPI0015E39C73|nr:hypothetical protein [Pseudomonas capeferrum]MBA1203180.1 hypothetical protein [Pseudomonas capeferrum]